MVCTATKAMTGLGVAPAGFVHAGKASEDDASVSESTASVRCADRPADDDRCRLETSVSRALRRNASRSIRSLRASVRNARSHGRRRRDGRSHRRSRRRRGRPSHVRARRRADLSFARHRRGGGRAHARASRRLARLRHRTRPSARLARRSRSISRALCSDRHARKGPATRRRTSRPKFAAVFA